MGRTHRKKLPLPVYYLWTPKPAGILPSPDPDRLNRLLTHPRTHAFRLSCGARYCRRPVFPPAKNKAEKNKINKINKMCRTEPFPFLLQSFQPSPEKYNKILRQPGKTEKNLAPSPQFLAAAPVHPYSFLHFFTIFYTIHTLFSEKPVRSPSCICAPRNAPG